MLGGGSIPMPEIMSPLEREAFAIIKVVQEQIGTADPASCLAWLAAYVALTQRGLSQGYLRSMLDPSKIVAHEIDQGKPHL